MKRPLCIATILYIIGIIMGLYISISVVPFILVVFILWYCIRKKKIEIIYMVVILVGFMNIKLVDMHYEKQYVLDDKEYNIQGIIISDKQEKEYKDVYQIRIININEKPCNEMIWLLDNKNKEIDLSYGDKISFTGVFEIPQASRNDAGFDYRQYLKTKKIYGTIKTTSKVSILEKEQAKFLEMLFYKCRMSVKNNIYMLLPEQLRELCVGILIGEKEDISEEVIESFKMSNLTHILAVSGAHISYLIIALEFFLKKGGKRLRKLLIIAFLLFFMGLTKYTPSVQRASIMVILTILASLLHKKSDVYQNIAFSAFIILLFNPYSILDIGFQLSYGGTLGIIIFSKRFKQCFKPKKQSKLLITLINLLTVTISANLVIIPILLVQFNTLSLTFWISNLLAGQLMGYITILGFCTYFIFLVFMPISKILSIPLSVLLKMLIQIAHFCSKLPFSSILMSTPNCVEILLYYIFISICFFHKEIYQMFLPAIKMLIPFKKKIIKIGVAGVLIFTSISLYNYFNQGLQINFIDVGQGDSTLIYTPNHKTILIDGGGSETGKFNVGEKTLLPYLLDKRITTIDYMLISHFDTDHVGGLLYLLEHIKVRNVIISKQGKISENYEKLKQIIQNKSVNIIVVKRGDKIQIDKEIYFDILFPEEDFISENVLNNNSIVAKLVYNDFSMLFTGDIEKIAEDRLIEIYKGTNALKSTILKVAHHGSKTSSTSEILNYITPKIALIGVGENNTFGHPNQGVIERLESLGTKIYRTDQMGEIQLFINKKLKIKQHISN